MFSRRWLGLGWLLLAACGDDGGPEGAAFTYDEVAELFGATASGNGSCSVQSCHGSAGEADLNFKAGGDLRALLVGVPACEAPTFNLVEPGDPERSWLWIKLTAPHQANGDLEPDPSWGAPATDCDGAAGFGKRMPRVTPYSLMPAQLDKIEAWIKAGAPGPDE